MSETPPDLSPANVRALRVAAGLTRKQLGRLLGYAPETVQSWERPRAKGGRRMTARGRMTFFALLTRIIDERTSEYEQQIRIARLLNQNLSSTTFSTTFSTTSPLSPLPDRHI